jgi:hypothetical protein
MKIAKAIAAAMLLIVLGAVIFVWLQLIEPETYLIPKGYRGPLIVIYNQDGKSIPLTNGFDKGLYTKALGSPIQYENGRRLYQMPTNGVLLTQFRWQIGLIGPKSLQFYYVGRDGYREKLETYRMDSSDVHYRKYIVKDPNKICVFTGGLIGSSGGAPDSPYQVYDGVSTYNDLAKDFFTNSGGWMKMVDSALLH